MYKLTTLIYHKMSKGPASINLISQYQKFIPRMLLKMQVAAPLELRNLRGYKALKVLRIDVGQMDPSVVHGQDLNTIKKLPAAGDQTLVRNIIWSVEARHRGRLSYNFIKDCPLIIEDLDILTKSTQRWFNIEVLAYVEWVSPVNRLEGMVS